MVRFLSDERVFGTGDSPKIDVQTTTHHGKYEAHSHQFYEIVYVADGFTLHSCNGQVKMLVAGDLFFVKPGEEHNYINSYQTKVYNCLFQKEALGFLLDELSSLPGLDFMFSDTAEEAGDDMRILHADISERRNIETALEKIAAERKEQNAGWKTSLRARLVSFLIRYARMYEAQIKVHTQSGEDYYGYVYRILQYINSNYSREITMADLSAVTGLSSDYMARKFKAAMHMSPSEYVRKFRISRAMELLCTTDLSVAEIAHRTGFSDISLFSRVFKQAVGLPPASYRKKMPD
ncbi:MAG: helix-turn-helix domain-containing protein [Clostridia bacterium]|nr:helix-turn-helix domain-containing protein [Clostridia bacterium]